VIARDSARIVGRALQRRLSGTFWWSRGEDRFAPPKSREIKELAHLRLASV
jgi:hypothetical protein